LFIETVEGIALLIGANLFEWLENSLPDPWDSVDGVALSANGLGGLVVAAQSPTLTAEPTVSGVELSAAS
jgi:hypothetical protein